MARLQVLELPAEKQGPFQQTPFVLVFDQVDMSREPNSFNATFSELSAQADGIKEATGARGVLVFSDTVEVA